MDLQAHQNHRLAALIVTEMLKFRIITEYIDHTAQDSPIARSSY